MVCSVPNGQKHYFLYLLMHEKTPIDAGECVTL